MADDAEKLPDEPRLVYVGNIPWTVKWQDLKDHMKTAGSVEFCKILTYDGSDWGRSRGVGYVRYATEQEAKEAVAKLNDTELSGRKIAVDAWTGAKPRSGPKGGGKGGKAWGKGWGYAYGKGFGKQTKVHGGTEQMVFVGNLPFKAEWQDLKDHMKSAGNVEFVKIMTEDGTSWSRSKGSGCVRYETTELVDKAIAELNGSEFMGRKITVDRWTAKEVPS